MQKDSIVSIGYFDDFYNNEPAILIWGTRDGLRMVSERMREFETLGDVLFLHKLPNVTTVHDARIVLEIVNSTYGLVFSENPSVSKFSWGLAKSQAVQFSKMIDAVAVSNNPCHNYLDCDDKDQVTVIVSQGEYDELFYV